VLPVVLGVYRAAAHQAPELWQLMESDERAQRHMLQAISACLALGVSQHEDRSTGGLGIAYAMHAAWWALCHGGAAPSLPAYLSTAGGQQLLGQLCNCAEEVPPLTAENGDSTDEVLFQIDLYASCRTLMRAYVMLYSPAGSGSRAITTTSSTSSTDSRSGGRPQPQPLHELAPPWLNGAAYCRLPPSVVALHLRAVQALTARFRGMLQRRAALVAAGSQSDSSPDKWIAAGPSRLFYMLETIPTTNKADLAARSVVIQVSCGPAASWRACGAKQSSTLQLGTGKRSMCSCGSGCAFL